MTKASPGALWQNKSKVKSHDENKKNNLKKVNIKKGDRKNKLGPSLVKDWEQKMNGAREKSIREEKLKENFTCGKMKNDFFY